VFGEPGAWRAGDVIDGVYRVEGVLGEGGMGTVYAAHDLARDVAVAIKRLPSDAGEEALRRFEREVELAARVDRLAGVVRVHSVGQAAGVPYCVMERIDGVDLERRFTQQGVPEPRALAALLEPVARTLHACHAAGVVHRDLKPANVLIRADGRPCLVDFGLARDAKAGRLTKTGELVGTPSYMAPEQVADAARAVSPSVDVYALGAILYRGLAGRAPFEGPVLAVLDRVLHREPQRPSQLRPEARGDLEAVCLRAMAKSAGDRYPSMAALADDLARVARGEPVEGGGSAGLGPRRRRLIAGGLVVLLGLTGAGLGVAVRFRRAQQVEAAVREARALDAQVLRPYAYGFGAGPAPDLARLEALAVVLAAAEGEEASALRSRLLAHACLARGDLSAAQAGRDRAHGLVAACLALHAGDARAARDSLAAAGSPAPLQVWEAVWAANLEQDPDAADALLTAAASAGPEVQGASLVREALELRFSAVAAPAWGSEGGRAVELELKALRERALALPGLGVEGVDAAGQAALLASPWHSRLGEAVAPRLRVARLRALLRVASLLGGAPRGQVAALLQAQLDLASKGVRRGEAESLRPCMALDLIAFEELGWRGALPSAYRREVGAWLVPSRSQVVSRDVLRVALLHDVRYPPTGGRVTEGFIHAFWGGAAPAFLEWPDGRARRYVELRRALELAGDDSGEVVDLRKGVEGILAPELANDLSTPYMAWVLRQWLDVRWDEADPAARTRAAEEVARIARRLIGWLPELDGLPGIWAGCFSDGYVCAAEVLESRGDEAGLAALLGEVRSRGAAALAQTRRRLAELDQAAPEPDEGEVLRQERAQAKTLLQKQREGVSEALTRLALEVRWPDHPETSLALLEEAVGLWGDRGGLVRGRAKALATATDFRRRVGRHDEAERRLAPYLAEALTQSPRVAREAVRLALERGALAEARRRLDVAERHFPGEEDLEEAAERLKRAEERAREGGAERE
jgi:predicted Ser/Thr protein kinase